MIEDFRIGVSPSLSAVALGQSRIPRPAASMPILVLGNPGFDRASHPDLPDLPGAAREAVRVASLYHDAAVFTGDAVTKARFREAGAYDVLHYAGHAVANTLHPEASSLLLAPDPEKGEEGTLMVSELSHARFDATRVVVLSACGTGSGDISASEGPLSLARPFLAAGVPDVVASLRDVEDGASSELFFRFHRALAAGSSPLEALRAAQIAMIHDRSPALRHPAAWAAFTVYTQAALPAR